MKECMLKHGGVLAEFSMKVARVHKSCLVWQVNEAVRITISEEGCIMNGKSEFHQASSIGEGGPKNRAPGEAGQG